ncbi:MAG: cytochrome c oxidase subunit 3 [Dehalococcoidia bacterium]
MAQASAVQHHATSTGTDNRKLLWWIFLGSECLFFGSLLTTYLIFKGSLAIPPFPADRIVDAAALVGISDAAREACHSIGNNLFQCEGILDVPVTSQSTFVLLMSSVTMVLAVYGAQNNHLKMMKLWLLATILLGLTFLGYQVFEFTTFGNEGLNLGSNQFGASFFMLTGFHGTHVAVGVLYLGSLLLASFRRSGLGPEAGFHIETAGLYWHFVDIVWIVLFTVIYLIPA